MSLDQVKNFIRVTVNGKHTSGASTISLKAGEASELPNITNGKYNLVWYDSQNFRRPDTDPNAEIIRVNSIDESNDTISVTRGVENTSATSKNTDNATYELFLGVTAKTITDIDDQKLNKTSRYTDSEASSAAPVQSVNSKTGDVSLPPTVNRVKTGKILIDSTGTETVSSIPFEPNEIQFHAESRTPQFNFDDRGRGGTDSRNYAGSTTGFARKDGASIAQQTIHSGGSGNSINQTGHYTSDSHCFAIRYSGQNGSFLGFTRGTLSSFNTDGFTLNVTEVDQPIVLLYTAYRTGAVTESLSEISHTGLTDISSNDHHSKTSSASELTDVSPDSTSSAHHSRYTNEEAQDAVGTIVNDGLQYDDTNDLINILAGNALTIDTSGNIKVVESNISHDNISGVSSSDHHSKTSSASELTDVSPDSTSSAHHSKTSSASELTDVSPDSTSNAHHSRYSDSEVVDAINGSVIRPKHNIHSKTIDSEITLSNNEGLVMAGKVTGSARISGDGTFVSVSKTNNITKEKASDIFASKNHNNEEHDVDYLPKENYTPKKDTKNKQIISMTTSSGQDINKTTTINWDEHLVYGDSSFTHTTGDSSVIINQDGTYKIYANIYTDTNSSRTNPSFYFRVNGVEVPGRSGSSYARDAEGHTHTSSSLTIVQELTSGDTIDIQTFQEASGGTCNLQNRKSIFTVEKLSR